LRRGGENKRLFPVREKPEERECLRRENQKGGPWLLNPKQSDSEPGGGNRKKEHGKGKVRWRKKKDMEERGSEKRKGIAIKVKTMLNIRSKWTEKVTEEA